MKGLIELLISIKEAFGIIHPTNPFVVDTIRLCQLSESVDLKYCEDSKAISFNIVLPRYELIVYLGLYQDIIKQVYRTRFDWKEGKDKGIDNILFEVPLSKLNSHDLNVLANFSQSSHVRETNIVLGEGCNIKNNDDYFHKVGNDCYTLA